MRTVLIDDENWKLLADFNEGVVCLHLPVVRKWSHNKLREYRRRLDEILRDLKSRGYAVVYGTPHDWDTRAQRLIELFGFERALAPRDGFWPMRRKI